MGWAEPTPAVIFAPAELFKAGRWALEFKDIERGRTGAKFEEFWARPVNVRWLKRLDVLTRLDGPPEATA